MKKLFKMGFIIFTIIFALMVIFIIVSWINHKIQLAKEEPLFKPIGEIVEVNGNEIHIYQEGSGTETLIFMSGGGTSSPVLDFKSLYSLLSEDFRIVVVEKSGYGFSEITNSKRDLDTILTETKEGIKLLGIEGPYILVPHSMSGLEALYWAQNEPGEVRAIIGLDMAVPKVYEDDPINLTMLKLVSYAAKIGITRWIPNIDESDALLYGNLSEVDKEVYRAVFFRRTLTKNMLNEIKEVKENAKKSRKRSDSASTHTFICFQR